MALVGMAMFGTISYVPLFVQGVIGTSATSSGVVLTPLLLGAVTTSFISGQIVSRTGRYRPNTLIGPLVLGLGELLLWRMGVNSDQRRGGPQHGDRRDRARHDDADLRPLDPELGVALGDGLGDRADAVLALDRRDARRDADGRDRQPAAARESVRSGRAP